MLSMYHKIYTNTVQVKNPSTDTCTLHAHPVHTSLVLTTHLLLEGIVTLGFTPHIFQTKNGSPEWLGTDHLTYHANEKQPSVSSFSSYSGVGRVV